ncbi:hypothetical protein LWI29_011587 [Acer saccharum]|uniref:Uncharacterized protein n=1 Tax=Acer saccharum TaxID=4024 RepID=A0AA39RPT4_ACESA|nr:hypothetical protein LWI29_011587 [Acer saccharum]
MPTAGQVRGIIPAQQSRGVLLEPCERRVRGKKPENEAATHIMHHKPYHKATPSYECEIEGTFCILGGRMKKSGGFGLKAAKGEHLGAKRTFGKKRRIWRFHSAVWPPFETAVSFQTRQVQFGGHDPIADQFQ